MTVAGNALTDLSYTYRLGPAAAQDRTLVQTAKDNLTNLSTAYTYDGLSRLTTAQTKDAAQAVVKTYEYGYDKNGNRTRAAVDGAVTTAAFNSADQLCWTAPGTPASALCSDTYAGATRYAYDANGNQTTTTPPSGPASSAAFNGYDQTTGFTPGGGTGSNPTYTEVTQNGRATTTDTLGTGPLNVTFTRTVLGVTARAHSTGTGVYVRDPSGTLVTWRTATTKRAYLTDRQGSVIAVVNTTDGTVDRRYTYDPYGATTKTANTEQYDSNPWRYTGAYQDNSTGLYKLGARYYQPMLGRFTQPDPSGQEANTYLYAGANPINGTDPSGLDYGINIGPNALQAIGASIAVGAGVTDAILVATGVGIAVAVAVAIAGVLVGGFFGIAGSLGCTLNINVNTGLLDIIDHGVVEFGLSGCRLDISSYEN